MHKKVPVVALLVAPTVLLAGAPRRVEVIAQMPLVAQVESPSMVELSPGETRTVTIRVACNQAWLVAMQSDNQQIHATCQHTGTPGGTAADGHTFTVTLMCARDAIGLQRANLATRLVSGPLAAGLQR